MRCRGTAGPCSEQGLTEIFRAMEIGSGQFDRVPREEMGPLGQVAALIEIDAQRAGQGLSVEIHQLERDLDKQAPRGGFVVDSDWCSPQ